MMPRVPRPSKTAAAGFAATVVVIGIVAGVVIVRRASGPGGLARDGSDVVSTKADTGVPSGPAPLTYHATYRTLDEVRSGGTEAEVVDGGDRRSAIALALRAAGAGDVVAVLGKGHEPGQEIDGQIHPFSDVDVLRQTWQEVTG